MKIIQCLLLALGLSLVGTEAMSIQSNPGFVYRKIIAHGNGNILALVEDTTPQEGGYFPGLLVVKTSDGGKHWLVSNSGNGVDQIYELSEIDNTVYAATYPNLQYWISNDFGSYWTPDTLSKARDLRVFERGVPGLGFARDEKSQLYSLKNFITLRSKYHHDGKRSLDHWGIAIGKNNIFVLSDDKLLQASKESDRWEEVPTNITKYPYLMSFHATNKDVLYFSATQNPLDGFASASGGEFTFVKTANAPNWSLAEFGLPKGIRLRLLEVSGSRAYFRITSNTVSTQHGIAEQVFYSEDGSSITKLPFDDVDLVAPARDSVLYFTRKSSNVIYQCKRAVTNCKQINGPRDLEFTRVRHRGI